MRILSRSRTLMFFEKQNQYKNETFSWCPARGRFAPGAALDATKRNKMTTIVKAQNQALAPSLWQEVENHLEQEKQRIFDEILNYPPPIPACDVQFNFLLAQRAEMMQALQRLREISGQEFHSLREFIQTCQFFDDARQALLLAGVDGVLDEQHDL